jgi:hypothetical protein
VLLIILILSIATQVDPAVIRMFLLVTNFFNY